MSTTPPQPPPSEPQPEAPNPNEPAPSEPSEPEAIDYGGSQSDIEQGKQDAHQADRERLAQEHGIE